MINIKSKNFDYTFEFINSFKDKLSEFENNSMFVIDKKVFELYRDSFSAINNDNIFLIEAKEENKTAETVFELLHFWLSKKMRRSGKAICLGGGITQDITSFASSIFLRGIDWYFFPTTLLAMSDSCIGGKCGVNFDGYKNQIGAFYPPKGIFADLKFLETLSEDDIVCGFAEIFKASLLISEDYFDFFLTASKNGTDLSSISNQATAQLISNALSVKKQIVELDEFEHNLRRILNYGHTFGHALETYTKYAVPHGKAVAWGIDVANYISYKKKQLKRTDYLHIKKIINEIFLKDTIRGISPGEIIDIIERDKKTDDNGVSLVILSERSHAVIDKTKLRPQLEGLFRDYISENGMGKDI